MHAFSPDSPRAQTLAAVLREAREGTGISQREVSRRLQVANTTVGRWERGHTVPTANDVAALLTCLNINGEERERILALASGSGTEDWLASGQPGISQQLAGVMECERTARQVTEWAPMLIPGMLQTSDYTRAILARARLAPGDAEARFMMRMARRDAFTRRRNPTELIALIGEPAIRGGIGGREVMVDQLHHLLDAAALENISLQLISVDGEWHPGHLGPFIIYEFESRRPTVYLEHHRSGAFVVDSNSVRDYRLAAETMSGLGLSPPDSIEFISDLVKTLEATP